MGTMDPQQERKRLTDVYAGLSDAKLEEVAAQAHELTDVARETLRAELSKRGLYVGQLDEPRESSAAEFRDLVTVRSFWNLVEAELAKGLLDAAGIESFLFDANVVNLDWFNANAMGGVKLRVDADNVEAAKHILEENVSNAPEPEGGEADETDSST
jgi:hypothetical protein